MTRRKNVPKKVAKKERPQTWDKKLKTLRKRYESAGKREENTLPRSDASFHMPNVVTVGRLRPHIMANRGDR